MNISLTALLIGVVVSLVCLGGCSSRSADDRVVISQEQRALNHGPGYAVVTYRQVDYARYEHGAVVVNPDGLEPVAVVNVPVTVVDPTFAAARADESQRLLEQISALQATVHAAARPASGQAAIDVPSQQPSQATVSAPIGGDRERTVELLEKPRADQASEVIAESSGPLPQNSEPSMDAKPTPPPAPSQSLNIGGKVPSTHP